MPVLDLANAALRRGDAVRVHPGVLDPAMSAARHRSRWRHAIYITDWQGVVTDIIRHDGRIQVTVEWDYQTLLRVPPRWLQFWAAERCRDDRFGFVTLDPGCLTRVSVRDTPQLRAAERANILGLLHWQMARNDLTAAAGVEPLEAQSIDVCWSLLKIARYLPSYPDAPSEEVEGYDDLGRMIEGRPVSFLSGTRRVDGKRSGNPLTYRRMEDARVAGHDALRLIAHWVDGGTPVEQEVVAVLHPVSSRRA